MPIRGIRYRCANCADFDLCSDCEATFSHHKTHIFYKIRVPASQFRAPKQEPAYPGRPHMMAPSLNSRLKKQLVSETSMEVEEIEGLYDQFTCLAATEWPDDPHEVGWAIDRRCFNSTFIPKYTSFEPIPNLIYDRVFAYFDTDNNTLIGLVEFIKGIDGLHSTDYAVKLRIAFNGYDVDGDGYVSRKDILRIFRAHYVMEKEATRNHLDEVEDELSVRGALETIHSSQPLGSAFRRASIPAASADAFRLLDKPSEDEGFQHPIAEDTSDTMDRSTLIRRTYHMANPYFRARSGEEAVRERWAQRDYYVDEEEGFTRPPGIAEGPSTRELEAQMDGENEETPTSDPERPRGSRSSSRVRFQDDIDLETRSNASTSSPPIGERWGGYEIPEPEKDLGKDVLYQITQQAFNELLDNLFKDKEDSAMDAFATRVERRTHAAEIEQILEASEPSEKSMNKTLLFLGEYQYATEVVQTFCNDDFLSKVRDHPQMAHDSFNNIIFEGWVRFKISEIEKSIAAKEHLPEELDYGSFMTWTAKLYRIQLEEELVHAVVALATQSGWLAPVGLGLDGAVDVASEKTKEAVYRDPTLPQFRPNSLADLDSAADRSAPNTSDTTISAMSDDGEGPSRYLRPDFGPFFALAEDPVFTNMFYAEEPPPADNDTAAVDPEATTQPPSEETEPPAPPNTINPPSTSTTPHEPAPPLPENTPTMQILYICPFTQRLCTRRGNSLFTLSMEPLSRLIRHEALNNASSPLHLPFLASLESVEREISERKGSGLLDYEEFESHAKMTRLRVLESWMDWVSF
jgi:Ca2+-binding EF-hand superfamily protein